MKMTFFIAMLLIAGMVLLVSKSSAAMPKAGDTAPLFTGKDQDGKDFNLADHIGKKIVLTYFVG
jgi:peroxiredoxin Q/BCP